MAAHRISLARRVFSVGRLSCAQPRPNSANLRGLLVNFLYSGVALSSKPPYASSLRSVPADSVSCTTVEHTIRGCGDKTNRLRREHAICSSLRSGHTGEELRCRRCGLDPWRESTPSRARAPIVRRLRERVCGQHRLNIAGPRPKTRGPKSNQ